MKKVLSIVLSIAMVLCMMPAMAFAGTASAAQANAAYSDTEGLACEGAVNVLSALGVVDGYTDGTYKPEQTVTRAEMAKLIVTALGVDKYATATTSKFTDMGAASWAIPYVEYASNLNIVNGYGYGLFGPNDTVTYEQAVTMIVRAIGYTDKCNEMNGTWPAIYVQKATALGLFENVVNGGAAGADRGDVAIMLYNALDVIEVYADQDGQTNHKYGADGQGVTMLDTLNKDGDQYYKVISSTDADTSLVNTRAYVGAAAKVTVDKDDNILAVGDIKTQFLTGDLSADCTKFKVDGKEYSIDNAELVNVDSKTGGKGVAGAMMLTNGKTSATTIGAITTFGTSEPTLTIAAKVSGITIKEVYSISQYVVKGNGNDAKVEESDLTQISKNAKLLGKEFAKDDDGNIDYSTFVLNGVSSLDEIAVDNIVYVYTNGSKITRVDVGTKTVTGTIDKVKTKSSGAPDKVTIDGTAYGCVTDADYAGDDLSNVQASNAGDQVTVYLDYAGDIYYSELEEGSTGSYAVILSKGNNNGTGATASANKVQLLTADGVKILETNNKKLYENATSSPATSLAFDSLAQGTLVKYVLNDDGKIVKIQDASMQNKISYQSLTGTSSGTALTGNQAKITKNGMYDSKMVAENATIFTVPTSLSASTYTWNWAADDDDYDATTLAEVKDSDVNVCVGYFYNSDNKIVAMVVDNGSTSKSEYGIITASYAGSDSKTLADMYIGSEKLDGSVEIESGLIPSMIASASNEVSDCLYKINKTTSGKYKLTPAPVTKSNVKTSTSTTDAAVKAGSLYDENDYLVGVISDDLIVYVYDKSEKKLTIGSKADISDDDVIKMTAYKTETSDKSKANFDQIDYIFIYKA